MGLTNSRVAFVASLAAARTIGRWSSRLGAVPASILWFTPWPVPVSARAREKQAGWLRQATAVSISTSVGRIAAHVAGEGRLVLLVHGWGEYGANLGAYIHPLTARGYRVALIDLPAHGRSSGTRTHIIAAAAAITEAVDHLGDIHAVIAHSMGANAALWALHHGVSADKVVLLAPNVDARHALASFTSSLRLPPKAVQGLVDSIEARFGTDIWARLDAKSLVQNLDMPALVVHDREDEQINFSDSEALVAVWPGARLHATSGLGHGRLIRDAAVTSAVVSFLEDDFPEESRAQKRGRGDVKTRSSDQ